MSTTPPGWYDDGRGALRWWDGAQWTEHVQTPDAEGSAPAESEVPAAPLLGNDGAAAEPVYASGPASSPEQAASAPPGYPGGFPGGAAPSGGFISATEPKKSKLWILWVVLGVVMLGIVVLVAVLIPVIIGLFGNSGSAGASDADETAAVASVNMYDQAWATADCDKFIAATTDEFRTEDLQLGDCTDFITASQDFSSSVENYELTVTSIERDDDEITITTSEKYDSLYDEQGELLDTPVAYDDTYTYTVVPSGGGWAIDDLEAD